MNKLIFRIVCLFLVPCLVTDPVCSAGMVGAFHSTSLNQFTSQAILKTSFERETIPAALVGGHFSIPFQLKSTLDVIHLASQHSYVSHHTIPAFIVSFDPYQVTPIWDLLAVGAISLSVGLLIWWWIERRPRQAISKKTDEATGSFITKRLYDLEAPPSRAIPVSLTRNDWIQVLRSVLLGDKSLTEIAQMYLGELKQQEITHALIPLRLALAILQKSGYRSIIQRRRNDPDSIRVFVIGRSEIPIMLTKMKNLYWVASLGQGKPDPGNDIWDNVNNLIGIPVDEYIIASPKTDPPSKPSPIKDPQKNYSVALPGLLLAQEFLDKSAASLAILRHTGQAAWVQLYLYMSFLLRDVDMTLVGAAVPFLVASAFYFKLRPPKHKVDRHEQRKFRSQQALQMKERLADLGVVFPESAENGIVQDHEKPNVTRTIALKRNIFLLVSFLFVGSIVARAADTHRQNNLFKQAA